MKELLIIFFILLGYLIMDNFKSKPICDKPKHIKPKHVLNSVLSDF